MCLVALAIFIYFGLYSLDWSRHLDILLRQYQEEDRSKRVKVLFKSRFNIEIVPSQLSLLYWWKCPKLLSLLWWQKCHKLLSLLWWQKCPKLLSLQVLVLSYSRSGSSLLGALTSLHASSRENKNISQNISYIVYYYLFINEVHQEIF